MVHIFVTVACVRNHPSYDVFCILQTIFRKKMFSGVEQDINQDGFEDILVGAPGVGTDAGSAYVVFGGAEFAAASYTLGSLGAADGFVLNAPSDNGYGGFSVAGTGERDSVV